MKRRRRGYIGPLDDDGVRGAHMTSATSERPGIVKSLVPARMDRLPWTRFHWLIVVGLGVS
jgi:hypothetical protein